VGLEGLLWHTAWQAAHSGGAVHSPVCPQNGLGQDAPPVLHQYTAEQEMREKQMLKAFHLASSRESKQWKTIATTYSWNVSLH
jgi:hypothetical protein